MTPIFLPNGKLYDLSKQKENSKSNQSFFDKLSSFLMADKVLYRKQKPEKLNQLNGKVVAIQNPFNAKQVVYRRVTATEQFWVRRIDNGGIIEIP
jgi:hypothetical protein